MLARLIENPGSALARKREKIRHKLKEASLEHPTFDSFNHWAGKI